MPTLLPATLEAVLFACGRALSIKKLVAWTGRSTDEIKHALDELAEQLTGDDRGVQLLRHANEAELITKPAFADIVSKAARAEYQGELTRPSLEALAVLAYRGPITRPELEQIRGVQSSLILRNLQMRGLVEMRDESRLGQPVYAITADLLKYLGMDRVESLPNYAALHQEDVVDRVLRDLEEPKKNETPNGGSMNV